MRAAIKELRARLGEVGAGEAGELVGGIAVVRAHVALDTLDHAQQLAAEMRRHVRLQPRLLRSRRAPRLGHRLFAQRY